MRLAADEGFNSDIVRGVLRRRPATEFVRVQDAGLRGADDPTILAWAAGEGRVLVTHDAATMTRYAYERVQRGEPMPGVLEVRPVVPVIDAIEDILLLLECSVPGEWDGQVRYLPLR